MPKILVIEDNRSLLEEIEDSLRFEGFAVVGIDNGLDGIRTAQEYRPDLILCDVIMPGSDGYAVLFSLRSEPSTAFIPFIFLTAKADRIDVRLGLDLGADNYLTKPFTRAELLGAITVQLEKHAAAGQEAEI